MPQEGRLPFYQENGQLHWQDLYRFIFNDPG
jgi:hypothetical protein